MKIIKCDHCGKTIEGKPRKVVCVSETRSDYLTLRMDQVSELDWCENCFNNLIGLLLDTSHRLFANPPVEDAKPRKVDSKFNTNLAVGKYSVVNLD